MLVVSVQHITAAVHRPGLSSIRPPRMTVGVGRGRPPRRSAKPFTWPLTQVEITRQRAALERLRNDPDITIREAAKLYGVPARILLAEPADVRRARLMRRWLRLRCRQVFVTLPATSQAANRAESGMREVWFPSPLDTLL